MSLFWIIVIAIIVIIVVIILSDSARNTIRDFVKTQQVRDITASFMDKHLKEIFISRCREFNPSLTVMQLEQLRKSLSKAITLWRQGKDFKHLIRGIVALAVPYGDYIYDLVSAFTVDTKINLSVTKVKKVETSQWSGEINLDMMLADKYGADRKMISRIPLEIKAIIVRDIAEQPLICGITLDEILNDGKIIPGIAVIIQNSHAYFFKASELNKWFSVKSVNPMTSEYINPHRDIHLLS